MSDQPNRYTEPIRGQFVPRGEPPGHHPYHEQRYRDTHSHPMLHHDPNVSRPHHDAENNPERSLAKSSRRSQGRLPQRGGPITGSPSTRTTAPFNPTSRQQVESVPVLRSPQSSRTPQRQPYDEDSEGKQSIAHATAGSRSPSRQVRGASFHDPGARQYLRSENGVLPFIGSHTSPESGVWSDIGPPYPTSLSIPGSLTHGHRAPRSEVFEQDGQTKRYERHTERDHREDDDEPEPRRRRTYRKDR